MKDTAPTIDLQTYKVNFVQQGLGQPVILIHGLAASLHDWDDLIPELVKNGYAAYALDLLGHGESGKPSARAYHVSWLFAHLASWIDSLRLSVPPILIGHSLGGYLALEYARRFPSRTSSLVLVNPFFRLSQLPPLLRISYRRPTLNAAVVERTPEWLFRLIADATTLILDHSNMGLNTLPERVRAQTTLDYKRTAPGVYNLPNTIEDLTEYLPHILQPTLVIWGERDATLSPSSFSQLVQAMPHAQGKSLPAGHVLHQTHPAEFNRLVLAFLRSL